VFLGRGLFRKRPGQHELGLEHGVGVVVALIPGSVQRLGGDAELNDEVVAQGLRLSLATLNSGSSSLSRGKTWTRALAVPGGVGSIDNSTRAANRLSMSRFAARAALIRRLRRQRPSFNRNLYGFR